MKLSNNDILQLNATILVGLLIFLTFQSFVSTIYDEQFNIILSDTRHLSVERKIAENYLTLNCQPFQDNNVKLLYNDTLKSSVLVYSVNILIDKNYSHPYMQGMSTYTGDVPSTCAEWQYKLYKIHFERYANEQWVNDLNVVFTSDDENIADELWVNDLNVFVVPGRSADFDQYFSTIIFFSTGAQIISVLITVIMIVPFTLSAIVIVFNSIYRSNKTEPSKWAGKLVIVGLVSMIVGFSLLILIVTCATFPHLNCFNVSDYFQPHH